MATKKRHWLWNILIVLTLITVVAAFLAHYKNWTKIEDNRIQILSGVYYKELNFSDINAVEMVQKLPSLQRINGFSVKETEKGIFRDSVLNTKVYFYVDKLSNQKIRITHNDSLELYFNYADSLETIKMYQLLIEKTKKK